ncbi:hypothetical protein CC86DRAFT_413077 [Ophiobolus disseminans]|uniref:C3H1-type domain-containing protein n=1 Tax=Ophiobolus disseminans TaxID=1469910 RepID=A0A6A6ZEE2_9PLEO|nr:hypothetical protein CC86DRAFT_413077 [Ophiobolus disseminans]
MRYKSLNLHQLISKSFPPAEYHHLLVDRYVPATAQDGAPSSSMPRKTTVNTLLPRDFDKPLTCYFWHQNGRCNKRDEDCANAHFNTGYLAMSRIGLPSHTGVAAVAGKIARDSTTFAADLDSVQWHGAVDHREQWLRMRGQELMTRERNVQQREHELNRDIKAKAREAATPPPRPPRSCRRDQSPQTPCQNTYESRRGSQVVLEFADPTASPPMGPSTPATRPTSHGRQSAPALSRATSWKGTVPAGSNSWASKSPDHGNKHLSPPPASQTRLQATFEAMKKMGSGLGSPGAEYSPRKSEGLRSAMRNGNEQDVKSPGYFDVAVEAARE